MQDIRQRIAALSLERRLLLERRLRNRLVAARPDRISPRPRSDEPPPLSFAQERLWFLEQLAPGSPLYNIPAMLRLGSIDVGALGHSIGEIVRRHESLRTTFTLLDGKPVQVIAPPGPFRLEVMDLRHLRGEELVREAQQLIFEEGQRPFNLTRDRLFRSVLLRLGEADFALLLTMHHIISDGWSLDVFFRELDSLYSATLAGKPSPLPELPIQYADFAWWQRHWVQGGGLQRSIAYWKQQMQAFPPLLQLPSDRPRLPVQSFRGATRSFWLPEEDAEAIRALGRNEQATPFMVLLAAFYALLYRYTGQEDLLVGTPIANRTRAELEGLIGFFVNTLVLRTRLDQDPSFRELIGRVREVTLGAYAHQDLPFERLVEELQPERSLSHNPLFQVMFVLQNTPSPSLSGALAAQTSPSGEVPEHIGTSKFDLTLSLAEAKNGLTGNIEYNTDLFDSGRIQRMVGHFQVLLRAVLANPEMRLSRLPLLTDAERQQLLGERKTAEAPAPAVRVLHTLLAERAAAQPRAPAVRFEGEQLSYEALEGRTHQFAHYLLSLGLRKGQRVGVCLERSPDLIVSMLGIWKAGGVYVPLSPEYPQERLAFMLEDSGARLLVTHSGLRERLPAHSVRLVCMDLEAGAVASHSSAAPAAPVDPDDVAYIIYTSGSTGTPKGVMVPHRALSFVERAQAEVFGVGPQARILQFASPSFDASLFELTMALGSGAALHLARSGALMPGPELLRLLREESITHITLPPSALLSMRAEPLPALRTLIAAGEACPAEAVDRWAPGRRFFNAYGPTEAGIWSTLALCREGKGPPSIGNSLSHVRAYVLDARMQPVPIGVPGELYLGGPSLAYGYANRPDLTASSFVPDAFSGQPGARLYRTGDIVRYRPDGTLEFLGRNDGQVKVRGFRVELGEVESVLRTHSAVQDVAVVVQGLGPVESRLVACWVARSEQPSPSPAELRAFLRAKLPEHLVPSAFIQLDTLPITPNGKVDRRALLALGQALPGQESSHMAPRTPLESMLASLWAELLQVERVGVNDNFFEIGGHSLLATRMVSRLREILGTEVPLRWLFEAPTIAELIQRLPAPRSESEPRPAGSIQRLSREAHRRTLSTLDSPQGPPRNSKP
ncbi:MAG: amino acid adenylation domain-containing protein [Myxococcaceae bacterium]|nr:amino acid adenylation domain-containing protein [Myxococcaceae bacterium]